MSLLDNDLDIMEDTLIKSKLLNLIKKSNYPHKDNVCIGVMDYKSPSKKIKYPEKYYLSINLYNNRYKVWWGRDDYINTGHIIHIHNCVVGLDEWIKDDYLFQVFETIY